MFVSGFLRYRQAAKWLSLGSTHPNERTSNLFATDVTETYLHLSSVRKTQLLSAYIRDRDHTAS